jgi:hypothetical protein
MCSSACYKLIDAIAIKKKVLISLSAISVLFASLYYGMTMSDLVKPPSVVLTDHSWMMQDSDE